VSSRGAPSLTICGSGNGAHALAVVASQYLEGEIDWLVGSEGKARLLRNGIAKSGLRSTGIVTAEADRVRRISADPAEVIPSADIVLIVVPAYGHAAVLRRIDPYLSPKTILGCLPARAGFEFDAAQLSTWQTEIVGLQSLPWSTRVTKPGQLVHIGAVKQQVLLAALPPRRAVSIAHQLTSVLGTRVLPCRSFLGLTLGNPGQIIHPGLMYGHFHSWHGQEYDERTIPLLYAQASDETGTFVERMSREVIAVARKIEAESGGMLNLKHAAVPIHDWLRRAYGHVTADTRTVATCFRTGPIQARKAPMRDTRPGKFVPDFDYRYLSEDVPFGLVATRALADVVKIDTPAIDEVLGWAQSMLRKTYLVGNELSGPDLEHLPIPQNHGISTLPELIDWYVEHGGDHAAAPSPLASVSV